MTRTVLKIALCGLAGLTVSGCSIPNFRAPEAKPPVQVAVKPVVKPVVAKPVVAKPVAPKPVAAVEVVEPKPASRWGHQRIGNTPNLSDGDESSGWGG